MKYKGIELKEFTSDKPVIFDPPKKMICWNDGGSSLVNSGPIPVQAYIPKRRTKVISVYGLWHHCAEIPEATEPRRATNRELAKWLAQGNGEKTYACADGSACSSSCDHIYDRDKEDCPLPERDSLLVRKWDDEEWHEPTADYMGLQ